MQQTWRTPLKDYLEKHYIQRPEEWIDFNLSTSGTLNMTIVSDRFTGVPLQKRREQVWDMLRQLDAPTSTGFLSLYTVNEAASIGLSRPPTVEEDSIFTWLDLAQRAANISESPKTSRREPRIPRTIAFYSFKGGVGRTTALIHVAWILAMRGRKVVTVDLDLEAPGLSSALNLTPSPPYGIVDYFYERSYMPEGVKPEISIAEIFGEVRIPDAPGRLFVVPAGSLDLDYIAKVDDLRATAVTEQGKDLWSIFFDEITVQLQPDIILVDSRTGINEWGAFSLLRAADKAIIFLYPNEQNRRGIDLLLTALAGQISLQLVFSPVPFGEAGIEKVNEHWLALQNRLDTASEQNDTELGEEIQLESEAEAQAEIGEPITIPYLTELALASNYPVQTLLSHYMSIANVVDEDTTAISLETVLADTDSRRRIVENLEFPSVDAAANQNLSDLFQRTADFEHFLDGNTCLIRGRKGTGKTALYELLLKYSDTARKLSNKRLDRVICLSGHGSFHTRPTRDEFQLIDRHVMRDEGSWETFWRAYLLLRMHLENYLQQPLKGSNKYNTLRSVFNNVPAGDWKAEHTHALVEVATNLALNLVAKDALDIINEQQRKKGKVLWFLYDLLDEDLIEKGGVRSRALTGLFQLVQACDARRLTSIRFKIFLREDIWSRIIFDNKSHFNGRDLLLQWTRADFLRLALRQAIQSKEFAELVDRFSPVGNIDQADESSIDRALQLLWGSRREANLKSKYVSRWVYDRLTDSSKTTFPRSLNILLKEAKNYELTTNKGQLVPPDRLLHTRSLNEGYFEASRKRCQEIREEYSELGPFFDVLGGKDILMSEEQLREIWQQTVQDEFPLFKEFVDFLLNIGLIGLAELRGKEQGYRFAEIYTHGFRMYRSTRKY